jgi:hypothetical protein
MKKITTGIKSFFVLVFTLVSRFGTGRNPNVDINTGLDYHPTPSADELSAAAKKYGTHAEDWAPLPAHLGR